MTRLTPVSLIVIAAALAACAGGQTGTEAPTSPTPLEAEGQSAEVTPTLPAPTQQPANVGLTQTGPWLLMHAESGLWALNADGAGLTQLYAGEIEAPGNLATAVSPSGGHIAFITSSPPDGGNQVNVYGSDLHLNILNLLSGESFEATRLNSDETRPSPEDTVEETDAAVEAHRAIIDERSLAWSPDGLTLAFMGMIDGRTSDLYTYYLPTGEITRLTDGPSQGYQPSWSPGGTYILHAGVTTFGTGAGYLMDGVWVARADGTGVIELYEPESYGEEFVGWLSDSTFLVYSWAPECGAYNLRRFDIESGRSASLTQFFDGPPAIDFASGAVLITISEYAAECNEDNRPGAWLYNLNELGGQLLWQGEAYRPVWSDEADAFFVTVEDGAIRITPDGSVTELPVPIAGTPVVAPGGAMWAWYSDGFFDARTGLWVGPVGSDAPSQIFSGPVYHVRWSPDGTRLFFFTDDGLMMLTPADGAITLVGEGLFLLNPTSAVWVLP